MQNLRSLMRTSCKSTLTDNRKEQNTYFGKMKTFFIILALAVHTVKSRNIANYDFHDLSSTTTSISCSIDSPNNSRWNLKSKLRKQMFKA